MRSEMVTVVLVGNLDAGGLQQRAQVLGFRGMIAMPVVRNDVKKILRSISESSSAGDNLSVPPGPAPMASSDRKLLLAEDNRTIQFPFWP